MTLDLMGNKTPYYHCGVIYHNLSHYQTFIVFPKKEKLFPWQDEADCLGGCCLHVHMTYHGGGMAAVLLHGAFCLSVETLILQWPVDDMLLLGDRLGQRTLVRQTGSLCLLCFRGKIHSNGSLYADYVVRENHNKLIPLESFFIALIN